MEDGDPRKARMEAAMRVVYPPLESTKKLLQVFKNNNQMVYIRACVLIGPKREEKVAVIVGKCLFYVCSLQGQVLRTLRYDQILGVDIARSLRTNVSFECVFLINGTEPDLFLVMADSKLNKTKSNDIEINKFFHCVELAKEALNNQPFPKNNKRIKELGVDNSHKQRNDIASPKEKLKAARERSMSPKKRVQSVEQPKRMRSPRQTEADEFTDYTFDIELKRNQLTNEARDAERAAKRLYQVEKHTPRWAPVPPPPTEFQIEQSPMYWLNFVHKWERKADGHMTSI